MIGACIQPELVHCFLLLSEWSAPLPQINSSTSKKFYYRNQAFCLITIKKKNAVDILKSQMTDVSGQAAVNGTSYDHNMLATEMESLQKEIERQSAQVNKLASSLNNFQVWVVGAMQRETGEVKLYVVSLHSC